MEKENHSNLYGKKNYLSDDEMLSIVSEIQVSHDSSRVEKLQMVLLEQMHGIIVSIASKFRSFCEMDDLIQSGNMGLIHAFDTFDSSRGTKVTTYCYQIAYQFIVCEINQSKFIPISSYIHSKYHDTGNIHNLPTVSLNLDEVNPVSGRTRLEELATFENAETLLYFQKAKNAIQNLIHSLPKRDEEIIRMRFGFDGYPRRLHEISRHYSMTKSRVSQIIRTSLGILKQLILASSDIQIYHFV